MRAHPVQPTIDGLSELEFRQLSSFNQGGVGVFWAEGGTSPWERHPDDDELLYVLEGEVEVTVLTQEESIQATISAGSVFVVPRGLWHRQTLKGRVKQLYVTPGATEHSTAEDPRRPS